MEYVFVLSSAQKYCFSTMTVEIVLQNSAKPDSHWRRCDWLCPLRELFARQRATRVRWLRMREGKSETFLSLNMYVKRPSNK